MAKLVEGRNGGKINQFEKGKSGNPAGRPKKVFSALIAEMKERGIEPATPSNVADIFRYLLALPLSDVIRIAGDKKQENYYPAIMRLAAKEMLGKRGIEILREMLDRANGKSLQAIETKGELKITGTLETMTDEQLRDEYNRLIEKERGAEARDVASDSKAQSS